MIPHTSSLWLRRLPMRDPATFEEAMSALVAAIGNIQRHPPTRLCEATRLAEQVSRIDAISVRAYREVTK